MKVVLLYMAGLSCRDITCVLHVAVMRLWVKKLKQVTVEARCMVAIDETKV